MTAEKKTYGKENISRNPNPLSIVLHQQYGLTQVAGGSRHGLGHCGSRDYKSIEEESFCLQHIEKRPGDTQVQTETGPAIWVIKKNRGGRKGEGNQVL